MKRDLAAGGPPRWTTDRVQRQLVDRGVSKDPYPAIEVDQARHGDLGAEVPVGLRVRVIDVEGDEAGIVGLGPGAAEGAAEVANLDVGAVLDDASQIRPCRSPGHPQLPLGQAVQLPLQRIARLLKV